MRRRHAVRRAFKHHQLRPRNRSCRELARSVERYDVICRAVQHQRRDRDFLQVRTEVGGAECTDALHRADRRRRIRNPFRKLDRVDRKILLTRFIVEERREKACQKRHAVGRGASHHAVKHFLRRARRIVGRLEQERRHRANEHRFRNARAAVRAEVARNFAAAHRETGEDDVFQIERRQQRIQIGRKRIVVVARRRALRLTEAATIVRNATESCSDERVDLPFPHAMTEWPAVDQHNRLTGAVIFVVERNRRRCCGADARHG